MSRDHSDGREASVAEQKPLHKLHTIRRPGRFYPSVFAADQNDRISLRREARDFRMLSASESKFCCKAVRNSETPVA